MAAVPLSFVTFENASAPGRTFTNPNPFGLSAGDPNSLQGGIRYSFRSQRYETFLSLPSIPGKCQVFPDEIHNSKKVFTVFSMEDSQKIAYPKA